MQHSGRGPVSSGQRTKVMGYTITAVPVSPGNTGKYAVCADEKRNGLVQFQVFQVACPASGAPRVEVTDLSPKHPARLSDLSDE